MKILFACHIAGIGGAERHIIRLMNGLKDAGIHCELAFFYKHSNQSGYQKYIDLLEKDGLTYRMIEQNSPFSIKAARSLAKFYREGAFDLINTHLIHADTAAVLAKKLFQKSIKIVSAKHGISEKVYLKYPLNPERVPDNLYKRYFRWLENNIDCSYACSFGLKKYMEQARFVRQNTLKVVQHGYEYPEINAANKIERSDNQLLMVGRLEEIKGYNYAIEIASVVKNSILDFELIILGEGGLRHDLEQEIKGLNLEQHVSLEGYKKNIFDYLAGSKLLMCTSLIEGLPLMLLEAFNAGVPVIAFDVQGCNEIIEEGKNGHLIGPFNTDEFANKVIDLLQHENKRKAFSESAVKRANTQFSKSRMMEETITLFRQCLI